MFNRFRYSLLIVGMAFMVAAILECFGVESDVNKSAFKEEAKEVFFLISMGVMLILGFFVVKPFFQWVSKKINLHIGHKVDDKRSSNKDLWKKSLNRRLTEDDEPKQP